MRAASERGETDLQARFSRMRAAAREAISPVERRQHALHGWVAYGSMPVFALANAGVALGSADLVGEWRVFAGVFVGLLVGKPLGILAVAVKVRYPHVHDTLSADLAQINPLAKLASLATSVDGFALVEELRREREVSAQRMSSSVGRWADALSVAPILTNPRDADPQADRAGSRTPPPPRPRDRAPAARRRSLFAATSALSVGDREDAGL